MNNGLTNLQRSMAVQRLTALWAFGESGLGGMLHAFQVPFTGLLVGSISVICICLIAIFCRKKYSVILKSLLLVLIVKALVSPQTPFPAYIAVSFQGFLGYFLFSIGNINFVTIVLLSVLTMIESAMQKLLLLTLFFGRSFWSGIDEMLKVITGTFGIQSRAGSLWVVGIYLGIYAVAGIFTALIAHRLCRYNFQPGESVLPETITSTEQSSVKRSRFPGRNIVLFLLGCSILLFAPGMSHSGSGAVLRSLIWTLTAVVTWYIVISPLVTKFFRRILMRSGNTYKVEAFEIISFLPFLKKMAVASWQATTGKRPLKRVPAFLITMVSTLLTFQTKENM
jgi:hypothetical protein